MATLTQTAYFARKAIKYGGIAFAALIFLRAGFLTIKKLIPEKPKPLPPPNIAFGKLSKMQFPSQNIPKINYRMETISGSLPKLPSRTRVYFMPLQSAGFLTQEKIITWAKNLGFNSNPQPAGNNDLNFRFSLQNSPGTTLDVNILTRNFYFNFDWRNNPAILAAQPLIDENQSTSKARNFFSTAGSFPPEIDPTFTKTVFLKNDNGSLVESIPQEASFHKINFFRQISDGVRIYPPDPKNSNISAVITSAENGFSGVIEAKFIHNIISEEINATYPVKDVNQAWVQLLEGKGYVANLGNNQEGNVVVRNAYLAYYEGETKQSYLYPIIVFEGDRDFLAYIPAITDSLFLE